METQPAPCCNLTSSRYTWRREEMIEIMAEKIKSLSKRLQLLKLIYQKQCTKKNIVALLVVKNHYSRSPCSRLFGNQGEVQDEDFHNSMTSSGYRPPSVQMLDGPSPTCFEDQTFFFFLSSVIRYIIQECVHTCLQSSSKLWDTTVQFH